MKLENWKTDFRNLGELEYSKNWKQTMNGADIDKNSWSA